MGIINFIKKLVKVGAIFGGKAKKLAGINDAANTTTDAGVQFVAVSNTIILSSTPPAWMTVGKYFRVKNGGGSNQDNLFKIGSISGNTITNDDTEAEVSAVVDFGPGTADLDGRIWQVINNIDIAKEDPNTGSTMFNIQNYVDTGLADGSMVANHFAPHYHNDHHASWDEIILSQIIIVEARKQMIVQGTLENDGTIINNGTVVIF